MVRASRPRFRFLRCASLALAFTLASGCYREPGAVEPGSGSTAELDPDAPVAGNNNRPGYKGIDLEYVGGEKCVEAYPDEAVLIKNKKPKKLRFWVRDAGEYYWEIAWDNSKGGATDNFFGAVPDITCADNNLKSGPHTGVPDVGTVTWPYKVTVYNCVDGEKATEVCHTDPGVRIKD